MRVLDLFSGIGGFSLGLERAGMRTVAFCEIEPYARAVLAKHWPGVPCDTDITKREFATGDADVICGGFPCQDISHAGSRTGITGLRSGLWREMVRAIRVVRPSYAIVENVAALLARGMGTVLGDLAAVGYDAEWDCVSASEVGAPHKRDRIWIVAYPDNKPAEGGRQCRRVWREGVGEKTGDTYWGKIPQPNPLGVVDGIPNRLDRLRCLGNSVVPRIPQIIGEAIMFYETNSR